METVTKNEHNYGGRALIPVIVFLGLYLGCGITFTVMGVKSPFSIVSRYLSVLLGILAGLIFFERKRKFSEKLDIYLEGAGASGVCLLAIIVLLAGAFASATAAIGGEASLVNLCVTLIPQQFIVPGIFLICCLISTCTGTSMGTQVTMIPIAMSMAKGAGVSIGMAGAAAIAGSYFGDNLSMISDTTIISCQGVGGDMRGKFLLNAKIALPAGILSMIIYGVLSLQNGTTGAAQAAGSYNILTILPYVSVLVLAVAGLDVVLVLAAGSLLSLIIGLGTGSITFFQWTIAMSKGHGKHVLAGRVRVPGLRHDVPGAVLRRHPVAGGKRPEAHQEQQVLPVCDRPAGDGHFRDHPEQRRGCVDQCPGGQRPGRQVPRVPHQAGYIAEYLLLCHPDGGAPRQRVPAGAAIRRLLLPGHHPVRHLPSAAAVLHLCGDPAGPVL